MPQTWEMPGPVISTGDRVGIRPYCTISAAQSIVIEDHVALRCGSAREPGSASAILHGAQIGRSCVIGANSVVGGRSPAFSVAVGAPARVVGSTRELAARV